MLGFLRWIICNFKDTQWRSLSSGCYVVCHKSIVKYLYFGAVKCIVGNVTHNKLTLIEFPVRKTIKSHRD